MARYKSEGGEKARLDPVRLVHHLHHYLGWLAACCGLSLAAAVVYLAFAAPSYQATTTLKVLDSGANISLTRSGPSTQEAAFAMETYVHEARSANVASRAIDALHLLGGPDPRGADREALVAGLRSDVQVYNIKQSNLLVVAASGRDPKAAADLSNAWASSFIDASMELSRRGASTQRRFIEEQLSQVRDRLVESEEVLRQFSTQKQTLDSLGNDSTRVNRDPLISLKTEVLNLEIEKANLESRYGPNHPLMKEVEAKLGEARAQLDAEMAKLPQTEMEFVRLSREAKAEEAAYNLLLEKLQEARIAEQGEAPGIVVLDPATPPSHPLYPRRSRTLLLAAFLGLAFGLASVWAWEKGNQWINGEEDLKQATKLPCLGLISDFRLELKPERPADWPLSWSEFFRGVWGLPGTRRLMKKLKIKRRSRGAWPTGWRSYLRAAQGLPGMGWLADFLLRRATHGRQDGRGHDFLVNREAFAGSYYRESFKIVRTKLLFSQKAPGFKTLAALSPGKNEGKTLVNTNLAVTFAANGQRVLLVDADLRMATLSRTFGLPAEGGFSSILAGEARLQDEIQATLQPNLWLLGSGAMPPNPAELLGDRRLLEFLESAKAQFDTVIFDGAPLLPVADSLLLAARLDGVLLLACSGQTRQGAARAARLLLKRVQARVLGTLLNKVDIQYYSYEYGLLYRQYGYSAAGIPREAPLKLLRGSKG